MKNNSLCFFIAAICPLLIFARIDKNHTYYLPIPEKDSLVLALDIEFINERPYAQFKKGIGIDTLLYGWNRNCTDREIYGMYSFAQDSSHICSIEYFLPAMAEGSRHEIKPRDVSIQLLVFDQDSKTYSDTLQLASYDYWIDHINSGDVIHHIVQSSVIYIENGRISGIRTGYGNYIQHSQYNISAPKDVGNDAYLKYCWKEGQFIKAD